MTPFVKSIRSMTQKEFNFRIGNGDQLVILDQLVLDVKDFQFSHPGSKFVIQQNVGRDISKFFYGGYSLENNLGQSPAKGYNHSNTARIIVNDLVIATYEPDFDCNLNVVKFDKSWPINMTTATFQFKVQ